MDKRVVRTRSAIRQTLLSLIGERPVERVTTTELCREAHINRNTFYAHYHSPEDVLREIEDELVTDLEAEMGRRHKDDEVALALIRHMARNQELYRTLWRCRSSRMKDRAMDLVATQGLEIWRQEGLAELDEGELFLRFSAQGSLAVVDRWLYNGCHATPEEIAKLISRFVVEGMRSFNHA